MSDDDLRMFRIAALDGNPVAQHMVDVADGRITKQTKKEDKTMRIVREQLADIRANHPEWLGEK
jgi:hypothetical protein